MSNPYSSTLSSSPDPKRVDSSSGTGPLPDLAFSVYEVLEFCLDVEVSAVAAEDGTSSRCSHVWRSHGEIIAGGGDEGVGGDRDVTG